MKKLILHFLFLLIVLPSMAQGWITIQGTVSDSATGNPVANHLVSIQADSSSGFVYYNNVYTNSSGYYADTIQLNGFGNTLFYITTWDCNMYSLQQTVQADPTVIFYTRNFTVCTTSNPCQANFTYYQPHALSIQFTDASVGGGTTRLWSFGDGTTSTVISPYHIYNQPGYYTVSLTIGALGTTCYDTISQAVYVWDSISAGCQAAFTAYPDSTGLYSYQFYDQSVGTNIISWSWSFGDGTSSVQQNPYHVYPGPGIYYTCLTIQGSDSTCFDYTCDTLIVGNSPGCQAEFTYYSDSLQQSNTLQFIDLSVGMINGWTWDFGDPASGANNTSTLQNPVHTFSAPGTYTICLSVQGADPSCSDMICHTITVTIGPGCQANFTWSNDPSTGGFKTIQFTDLSTGNPTAWSWSFGDGTSGSVQNPVHTYASAGVYNVTLTITANNCTSSFTQSVTVVDSTNYHQLYGQIFAGQFPVDLAVVVLFSVDTTGNAPVFVTTADSSGVYYFTLVPDGNYYILAIPFDSNGYLPTYYGNTINWEAATLISLGQPINPYNINLVQGDQLIPGGGSASGQINMGSLKSSMLDKVNMIVLNADMQPLSFTSVTESGAFEFPSMAFGTYYLHAEMAGITSDYVKIVLSEAKPHADIVMTFTGNSILGSGEKNTPYERWTAYPNPFSDNVTIELQMKESMTATITLFDLTGRIVLSSAISLEKGSNRISLPTAALEQGGYFMQVTSDRGLKISSKLIKTR